MIWEALALFVFIGWLLLKIAGEDKSLKKGLRTFMLGAGGIILGLIICPHLVLWSLIIIMIISVCKLKQYIEKHYS